MLAIRFAAWLTSADMLSRLYNRCCVLRVTLQPNYERGGKLTQLGRISDIGQDAPRVS